MHLALALLFAAAFPGAPSDAQCARWAAQPPAFPMLRDVYGSCAFRLTSPDGRRVLLIGTDGDVHVQSIRPRADLTGRPTTVDPPAAAGWSPDSDRVFINDGDGSGLGSRLRFYARAHGVFQEDRRFLRRPIAAFRRRIRCARTTMDPNVWGLGFSRDRRPLYVLIQSGPEPYYCGGPQATLLAEMDVRTARIAKLHTDLRTTKHFRPYLPADVRDMDWPNWDGRWRP